MSNSVSRREILKFFGASAAGVLLEPLISDKLLGGAREVLANGSNHLSFTPVRLPHPLPIYQESKSFLANGPGTGAVLPKATASAQMNLTSYTVIDDLVVPPEYKRYVIVHWGEHVFPNPDDYVGYNADYTGFVPFDRHDHDDDDDECRGERGYLWVNHEYVSYPASRLSPGIIGGLGNSPTTDDEVLGAGNAFPTGSNSNGANLVLRLAGLTPGERRQLYGEFYYNQGGSVLVISRQNRRDEWEVVKFHNQNRRIHGLSGLAINALRPDGDLRFDGVLYKSITSWGPTAHQQGDLNYLIGTGPAVTDVFEKVNADGLGNKIIGTAFNCSGATTPWGTIMSAEENFQGGTTGTNPFYIGVNEEVKPNGSQFGYLSNTAVVGPPAGMVVAGGTEFGQVGEKYGWLVEIDPSDSDFRPRKHTALGRYRHENITMRVERGEKLVAYMGDDRRGGHTWKYVSEDKVTHRRRSRANSKLLEEGTLYVAQYNADGTGKWIPLKLSTPTSPPRPSDVSSVPFANGFTNPATQATLRNGRVRLPRRIGVAGQSIDGGSAIVERDGTATSGAITESTAFQAFPAGYLNATLASFYPTQGAILCDAFHAGNLVGGTPAARPEDLEINPRSPREVLIAFTDGAPGGDGYPDSRIFQVAKLTADVNATQQPGGLYKITEDRRDGTGLTFRWQKLEQGGEAAAVNCSGFAAVDNLAFDNRRNVWGVTDMSTGLHNGFTDGLPNNPTTISHAAIGDVSNYIGVFGNNWLFFIPTSGKEAGEVFPFAYGPTRSEMTGPTFVENTLIISVQHPGEDCDYLLAPFTLNRDIEMLALNGTTFTQNRTVTRSSNWPSNIEGMISGPPRPCVVAIQRKDARNRFI